MSNLKKYRTAVGLSQSKLAERSGVKLKSIQKYESGEKDINKAQGVTLYNLSIAVECKMEDLLEFESNK